jgi:hypothetical protein
MASCHRSSVPRGVPVPLDRGKAIPEQTNGNCGAGEWWMMIAPCENCKPCFNDREVRNARVAASS